MAFAIERRRVRLDNVVIAYEVAGEGPPLMLVHGLSGSSRWWQQNLAALAARYRVYIVDLIGFGASRGQRFVLEQASAYLARWFAALEIESAQVIGHSMGGFIAADLAADHPQLVERLVLVDPALLLQRGFVSLAVGLVQALPALPFNFMPTLFYDALRAGPFTLASALLQLVSSDLGAKLVRVHAPTMIVWGEYDTLLPPSSAEAIARALPAVEAVEIIRGAGHNPMWDQPEAFNRVVLEFLEKSGIRSQESE